MLGHAGKLRGIFAELHGLESPPHSANPASIIVLPKSKNIWAAIPHIPVPISFSSWSALGSVGSRRRCYTSASARQHCEAFEFPTSINVSPFPPFASPADSVPIYRSGSLSRPPDAKYILQDFLSGFMLPASASINVTLSPGGGFGSTTYPSSSTSLPRLCTSPDVHLSVDQHGRDCGLLYSRRSTVSMIIRSAGLP